RRRWALTCVTYRLRVPTHVVTGAVEEAAAAKPDLPHDGGETGNGMCRLAAIAVSLHAVRELEQRGLGATVASSQCLDSCRCDAGDGTDPLGGIGRSPLA